MDRRLGRREPLYRIYGSCVGGGLGRLGLVMLRPTEAWVGGLGLGSTWAGDVETGDGVTKRERER